MLIRKESNAYREASVSLWSISYLKYLAQCLYNASQSVYHNLGPDSGRDTQ
jgi:hypothetical protein